MYLYLCESLFKHKMSVKSTKFPTNKQVFNVWYDSIYKYVRSSGYDLW